jgi:8-oxo-dGTP diphosphatase
VGQRLSGINVVVVLLTISEGALKALLVRQDKARWCLPNAQLDATEPLRQCAERVVANQAGISVDYLEQLYTFGNIIPTAGPRTIDVAYYGLVPSVLLNPEEMADRSRINWFSFSDQLQVAEGHQRIIKAAVNRLRGKLAYTAVGFELLQEAFTLAELQNLYEIIQGKVLDKRNFRKKVFDLGILEPTSQRARGRGRPALLYRFKPEIFKQIEAKGDIFQF